MDTIRRKCGSFLVGVILGFSVVTFAADIPSPPILADLPVSLQHYLKLVYGHLGRVEVVTTTPNGSRNGKKGEMLQVVTGGNYYHCQNIDGATTWYCVQITNIL